MYERIFYPILQFFTKLYISSFESTGYRITMQIAIDTTLFITTYILPSRLESYVTFVTYKLSMEMNM